MSLLANKAQRELIVALPHKYVDCSQAKDQHFLAAVHAQRRDESSCHADLHRTNRMARGMAAAGPDGASGLER
jgi:hypothetical protein